MPVFLDLGLLFVHIPKNAGRSIEEALFGEAQAPHSGRRSTLNRAMHALTVLTAPKGVRSRLVGTLDQVLVAQHLTYGEMDLLGLLPQGPFVPFAVCRNPYDRAVSSVSHFADARTHAATPNTPDEFERALLAWLDREPTDHNERAHRRPQIDYVHDRRGQRAVETVLRYETLGNDFSAFMTRVGQPQITLPWHGRSKRSRDHRDYLTPAARARVEAEFGDDIEAFGYKF
jgi:hypothetical protein